MSKYTLKECKENLIEMWKWLSENPDKGKKDFLKAHPNFPQELCLNCPCCEYTSQHYDLVVEPQGFENVDCTKCPITWPLTDADNFCGSSYFGKWGTAFVDKNLEKTKEYATIIYKLACEIKDDEDV